MRKQKVTAEYIALTLLLFVLQAMWPSSMNAQVVGATLSGVVADSSGAAVPAAKISIRNVGTDDLREVSSNAPYRPRPDAAPYPAVFLRSSRSLPKHSSAVYLSGHLVEVFWERTQEIGADCPP